MVKEGRKGRPTVIPSGRNLSRFSWGMTKQSLLTFEAAASAPRWDSSRED